jgi:hypothetical protein
MAWEPTNANDVRLTVSTVQRNDKGDVEGTTPIGRSDRGGDVASIVVDSFSIDSSGSLDPLHGLSNSEALGMSQGNIEHEFSFTVMGEYYELLESVRRRGQESEGDPRSVELEIVAQWQGYRTILNGAFVEEKNSSVSDGETAEHEFSGYALRRDPREGSE